MNKILGFILIVLVVMVTLLCVPTVVKADGGPCGMNGCKPVPPMGTYTR